MEIDEGIRQRVVDTTAERSTIVVDVSEVVVSDEQRAANDATEAEMTAEVQADQNSGASLFECILVPPEKVVNQKGHCPKDINNWTT
eukprot:4226448-Pyramimonas_sp.AAC.2